MPYSGGRGSCRAARLGTSLSQLIHIHKLIQIEHDAAELHESLSFDERDASRSFVPARLAGQGQPEGQRDLGCGIFAGLRFEPVGK